MSSPSEGNESPEAIGSAILAAQRVGNELIAEARAEAARLLRESAAISERLAEQTRAAAADIETDLANQREALALERERFDREVSEWKARFQVEREAMLERARAEAESSLAGGQQRVAELARQEEELRHRIGEERDKLVSLLRWALAELEPLDAFPPNTAPGPDQRDLTDALASRVASNAAAEGTPTQST